MVNMKGFTTKTLMGLILLNFINCAISKSIINDSNLEEHSTIDTEDYEIIPIHRSRIQKRDTGRGIHLSLKAFGEHIKLWLEPHDGVLATAETPIFFVSEDGEFGKYDEFMKHIVKYLYQNAKEAATMIVTELPNGNFKLDGIIGGKRLAIRPITNKYYYKRYKRFIDNIPESEHDEYNYHIVSKLPEVPDHQEIIKPSPLTLSRSKRSIPDVIYPEVFVMVDYSMYKKFHSDHYEIVKYVLAFWNSVDFAYRSLQNPKYRINIAGIAIAEGPKSLKYMQHVEKYPDNRLLVRNALLASAQWVKEIDEILRGKTNFDVVVTLSALDFINPGVNGVTKKTVGLAYRNGACSLPIIKDTEAGYTTISVFKSAIVHDEGGYANVNTAAHELGHLLGASHDGVENHKCDDTIGHLMAPTSAITANSSDWSSCSVKDFENFLNSPYSECLFNKPKMGTKISRFLPGKLVDADTQCKYLGNSHAVEIDESICVQLKCASSKDDLHHMYAGVADGTPCGKNKICLHKQCIDLDKITY